MRRSDMIESKRLAEQDQPQPQELGLVEMDSLSGDQIKQLFENWRESNRN